MKKAKFVILFSGGLDSTILVPFILENYAISKMYPLFINRGQGNFKCEKQSVKYFEKYFRGKYGSIISRTFIVKSYVPAKEFKRYVKKHKNKEERIYALRNSDLINKAVRYALLIEANYIAIGLTYPTVESAKDFEEYLEREIVSDSTPWYLKAKQHEIAMAIKHKIFLIAPFMDHKMTKSDVVRWGLDKELPLEKTCSCFRPVFKNNKWLHCGICKACKLRKKVFKKAEVKDKTLYNE